MRNSLRKNLTLKHLLTYVSIIVGAVGVVLYISYQARFLLQGPVVTLEALESVQTRTAVTVKGNAQNIVAITLNGRPIFTDESGNFKEALILENGYTIMTLRAEDRFGRETVVQQPFVYQGKSL